MEIEKILKSLSKRELTEEIIKNEFEKRNIQLKIKKIFYGPASYNIKIEDKEYYLLEKPLSYHKKKSYSLTHMQQKILEFSIPIPIIIGQGEFSEAISKIKKSDNPQKEINSWLFENFTIEIASVFYNKYFKKSESLKGFQTIIFESIEAFYSGLDHVAIMSLFPVFEAGLRNIQNNILKIDDNTIRIDDFLKKLRRIIINHGRKMINQYKWYPGIHGQSNEEYDFFIYYNQQCDLMNSFSIFLEHILYKADYKGITDFNRNNILHLFNNNFKEPTNYLRLVLTLSHIMFIESLNNENIPFMWPGIDDEDIKVATYIRNLSKSFDQRRPYLRDQNICRYDD